MPTIGEVLVCLVLFAPVFLVTEMFREKMRRKAFKKWLEEGRWRYEEFKEW